MGEEWGATTPFLFFTDLDAELGAAVRDGRRKEFAEIRRVPGPGAARPHPDPNAPATFEASIPDPAEAERPPHDAVLALHRRLLAVRHARIVPQLPGTRAIAARAVGGCRGARPLAAGRWQRADLGQQSRPARRRLLGAGEVVFESMAGAAGALGTGTLPPRCTVALIELPDTKGISDGPMMKGPE